MRVTSTKLLLVFLLAAGVGAALSSSTRVLLAQRGGVPLATPEMEATAPLAISEDGHRVTLRKPAWDTLEVCVEPRAFGRLVCFTVGDVRDGKRCGEKAQP
jgi:hypothetical protein